MKYGELYEWAWQALTRAGIGEAKLEARLLLEFVCDTKKHDLIVHGDAEVTREQEKDFRAGIEKRLQRIPLAYITGSQEFMGLTFKVTPDVLIPRQDTETLVEEVLRYLHDGMAILDLCTGSGCILLSLLWYSNACRGVGADISRNALQIAGENARALGLSAEWTESDLFAQIAGKFDIMVSNPPYIKRAVIETLEAEVSRQEPHLALDGGVDGLVYYKRILEKAGHYLYHGGRLFLEIGYDQAAKVSALMQAAGFYEVICVQDLAGKDRVIHGIYGGDAGV